ncbi:hypothetical protein [Streptomyces sp. NBC_00076]|uniref:hypothetical protein n=1 Tax=Streptomyces sp. NBC_00076 TaxID=2975642 RepID=UPI0032460D63
MDLFAIHTLPVGRVVGFGDDDEDDETMADEAALAEAVLRRMSGRAVEPVFAGTSVRSLAEADEALAHWSGEHGDDEPQPSVLLWVGHGCMTPMGSVLLVPGAEKRDGNARVTPDMVAHHVHKEQERRLHDERLWAIVVFEACNSEYFALDVARRFNGAGQPRTQSLLLIGTGRGAAQGYLGTFRRVLESWVDNKTAIDKVFTLRDLQKHFSDNGCHAELVGEDACDELPLVLRDRVPLAGAITVAEQRRLQSNFDHAPEEHPHLQGPDTAGFLELVHHFTGRAKDLRAVDSWCADPGGADVLAVTGVPGVGKSALLGETVMRWSRRRVGGRDRTGPVAGSAGTGVPGGHPGVNEPRRLAAVLALTGSTPADVVRQLADLLAVRVDGSDRAGSSAGGEPADAVRRRLAELADPGGGTGPGTNARTPTGALIVADALDEARDPLRVAALLRDLTTIPGVRLLIGTRPSSFWSASGGWAEETSGRVDLLEVLGTGTGHADVLTLEPDPTAVREYTEHHIRRILRERTPAGEADWHEAVAHEVAEVVADHVGRGAWQFLQAALVVQEIEERPTVASTASDTRAALGPLLERDQKGLFGAAVARITAGLAVAEPLLRALAYAHGRGLPLADGIWTQAAAGIAGADDRVDDHQLRLFLSRAAAYVLLDGEDRRSVYRLAHRTYAEQLLADATPGGRYAMFVALLDLAAEQADTGLPLSPHLAARLAEYAADCGPDGWAALAARPAVVDRLAPASLSTLALTPGPGTGATSAQLPVGVLGTVASAHLIKESAPDDRPGLRQLGGLRAAGVLHEAGPGAAWEVCWGRMRRVPLHLRVGADAAVTALVARPDATWLVTGFLDGTVVVWEPWKEHGPVVLLRGCDKPVSALAAHGSASVSEEAADGPAGPGVLAVAHDNRTLQLWDTDAEHPQPLATSSAELVTAMVAIPDGTRRFVVAGEAGYLALLGPGGELCPTAESPASTDVVGLALASGTDGNQLVVAAYRCGLLGLWEVGGGAPSLVHQLRARTELSGLTRVTDPGAGARLVTASDDGRLAHWRVSPLDRGPRIMPEAEGEGPEATDGANRVLAALPVSAERSVPVLGDARGVVRVVNSPAEPGHPQILEASTASGAIKAIGALRGPQSGRVLATAAERDCTVHFWDPSAVAGAGAALVDIPSAVSGLWCHVLADGTETLVVAEQCAGRTTLRTLRAADGKEVPEASLPDSLSAADADEGQSFLPPGADDQHSRIVGCVTLHGLVPAPRGTETKVTAGREGTVVVWRNRQGSGWKPVRRIRLGAPCLRLTTLSEGRLAVATDDGVLVLRINPVAWPVKGRGTEETHV